MTDSIEVAVTSECSGQLWSVSVWDVSTGSQLMAYKGGGVCGARALSFVGSDYLVAAEMTKPLLHVWPVNSTEPSHELRTVSPGIIGALAVSPDGRYLVASIGEKIHVWQIESGRLMGVASRHYQPVTCIRFIEDGTYFLSAGEDGMVLVWCLSHVVNQDGVQLDFVHAFSDHYLPVNDLYVSNGVGTSRIFSVSADGSCRIYDFGSKKLLLSLIIDGKQLTSISTDVLETSLFLGCTSGEILTVGLCSPPRQTEHHITKEDNTNVFRGHTKAVTSLSSSQDAISLLSGSADETVRIWHIESKQCLRIIQHKGPVKNAFFTFITNQMFAEKLKPSIVMHRLQRSSHATSSNEWNLEVVSGRDLTFEPFNNLGMYSLLGYAPEESNYSVSKDDVSAKSKELIELKMQNIQLFKFASEKILREHTGNGTSTVIPSLIDIDVALQQVDERSIIPEPVYKLGKKIKKNQTFSVS